MAELETLLQQEIPGGRKALLDSKANLENVANYCQQMYIETAILSIAENSGRFGNVESPENAKSDNKKAALDETKNFTTQSLASVAYQINTLASNMLHMLDIQAAELANMESSINNISMTVDIHKEKVARREIGLLTTNKVVTRNHQIMAPANPDRSVKYVRKPIDYAELDDIGHGVKLGNQQSGNIPRRVSKTPSPSVDGRKRDSLKSNLSSTGYGTIRAVRTPTVPTDFSTAKRIPSTYRSRTNSNSSSGSGSLSSSVGYLSGVSGSNAQPPPTPPAAPTSAAPPPPPNVPPPPPAPVVSMDVIPPPPPPMENPPPPPPPAMAYVPQVPGYSTPTVGNSSRPSSVANEGYASTAVYDPLPPPPSSSPPHPKMYQNNRMSDIPLPPDDIMPPPPPADLPSPYLPTNDDSSSTTGSSDPPWAPKNYELKVIAIYDYSAENADELTLREDEIVYVVRRNDDGWYEGVLNGVTGLFPGNYVEQIST